MAEKVDWINTLDRVTDILVRVYLAQRAREAKADGDEKKALHEQFQRDIHFTVRRLADMECSRLIGRKLDYTRRGSKKRGTIVERNVKLLGRFVLEDVAAKAQKKWITAEKMFPHSPPVPIDTAQPVVVDRVDPRSNDRFHELINEFPEIVYTREEVRAMFQGKKFARGRRVESKKERVVGTPYSATPSSKPELSLVVLLMSKDRWPKEEAMDFLTRAVYQMDWVTRMDVSDVVEVKKQILFQAYVKGVMAELGLLPKLPPDQIQAFVRFVASAIYGQATMLAEMHWFRSLSVDRQKALIWREPQVVKPLGSPGAKECVREARTWLGSAHAVHFALGRAFEPLVWTQQGQTAVELFKACLGLDLSEEGRANCLHSLAHCYRIIGQTPQMKEALLSAARVLETIGGHPGDLATELAYLAELARIEGDRVGYMSLRTRADTLAQSDEITIVRRTWIAFFMADAADIYEDVDWELEILDRGQRLAIKDERLKQHFEYFEQCITDLKFYGKRGPEDGEGRVQAPAETPREEMSGVMYFVIDDPDAAN